MRNRSFILAVAAMAILAAMIMAQNVRESKAPLYGAPNVDRSLVMRKVAEGALSFREARFYSIDDAGEAPGAAGAEAGGGAPGEGRAGARGAGEAGPGGTETAGRGDAGGAKAGDDTRGGADGGRRSR